MSDYDSNDYNFFGFIPNLASGILFTTLFSILSILHILLTGLSRRWWAVLTVIGGLGEVAGWIGRLGGHFNYLGLNYYLLNQVMLALSPVFFSATLYVTFGRMTILLGTEYSRLSPKKYWIYFSFVDIICLVLQGTGGGMSGSAASDGSNGADVGRDIYLAGIAAQLFSMLVFCFLVAEYFWRVRKAGRLSWTNIGGRPMKLLLTGVIGASVLIIFRNFYRCVELGVGFDGYLATEEAYFDSLDAVPMVFCMVFLAIAHPLFTLNKLTGEPATGEKALDAEKTPDIMLRV